MRIGAHLTIAKGLPEAARLAGRIGADTFQYFTRNPRGGAVRGMGEDEIRAFWALREEAGLGPIVGHLPYTVNLAAGREETRAFAVRVLREDLERAGLYGAESLAVHPGSHGGDGVEAGIERIVRSLDAVLDGLASPTALLLETMAGQGSEVGFTPDHLGAILDRLGRPANVGVCLDSCHLFAAGFDLRTHAGIDALLEALEAAVGLERVRAMHLNDSKTPLGSRRDRHELLGRGHLGEAGMISLLTHPFLRRLPLLIETPVAEYIEYGDEIRRARAWAASGGERADPPGGRSAQDDEEVGR